MIHKVDHFKKVFLCHRTSVYSGFICSACLFLSVTRRQETEWMSKHCQKVRFKVKESFCQISELFLPKLMYIYIYALHHITFAHFIPSTVLFSLQISKYYWFVFVWCWVLCLIFTFQHTLTILFLSEFSFESFTIFFSYLSSFTDLPPHFTVKVLLFVKHNSPKSSANKVWLRKFCKRLSIYPFFICFVQEKQLC